ncbi:polymorphic toxin-type HINT domain-containing protein [Promicromonospora sp. MS192]|uniref:polymorphic toxin-type HINT domain-containing protein n=1 Tax=Promicromonospora sp. MS192 TaxID=3412684 RepID=UPI003C2E55AD
MDPTPGDPVLVLAGGQEYLEVARSIDDAAGAMSRLDVAGTVSQAVDSLMGAKEDTIGEIRRAHARYVAAGDALVGYASALERVQGETLAALDRARDAQDQAASASGSQDRWQELADSAKDETEKQEYQSKADQAGNDADQAAGVISGAKSTIESAVSDRDRAANAAVDRIEEITSSDDLNDSWWDDWGSKLVAAIADIADMISTIAGILAIVVAFIPVVGQALAGVLIVIAAVAAIVSAVANITLAATGERSWAEAGIAIAGAALSLIGLGGAAKAAMGLSKSIAKGTFKQGLKNGWCKFGFGKCFVAGTMVRTPDGPRPIEEIRVGDKVWAHDTVTGRDELGLVAETFVRSTDELFHLRINDQVVSTTAEHPFMVAGRGWIDAAFLKEGDLLVTPEGTTTPVQAIEIEQRPEDQVETVYNFHVETYTTYYVHVGEISILVHNAVHANALKKNHTYKINGGSYKVDGLGRPAGIDVKLTKSSIGGKTNPSVKPLGYDPSIHQAGHLHGAQLGGPNDHAANFVSQYNRSNNPWQRAIEGEVRKVVENGEDVVYKVTPQYDGASEIPHSIHFSGQGSNGYQLDYTLSNSNLPLLSQEMKAGNISVNQHGFLFGTR